MFSYSWSLCKTPNFDLKFLLLLIRYAVYWQMNLLTHRKQPLLNAVFEALSTSHCSLPSRALNNNRCCGDNTTFYRYGCL